jgi:hypothetical protein
MRSAAAITLVLLGSGATAVAVDMTKRCHDPLTGQPIACPSSSHGGGGSYGRSFSSFGGWSSSGGSGSISAGQVSRGGFGAAGASMHASS